jgi:hypothetical protein
MAKPTAIIPTIRPIIPILCFIGDSYLLPNVKGLPPATGGAPPILVEVLNHPPTSTPER